MSKLRGRGVTGAVICSTPFMKMGTVQAQTFGVPDLPLIELPHPFGSLCMDEVKQCSQRVIEALLPIIKERLS